jgi:hypothetical protein
MEQVGMKSHLIGTGIIVGVFLLFIFGKIVLLFGLVGLAVYLVERNHE